MPISRKSSPWLAQRFRERIQSGQWKSGQMIPGRRTLATEYAAALTTVERAVATLLAEGLLRADDRRGTFVASATSADASAVQATVGLVAAMIPYENDTMRREQWSARVLAACEHTLASQPGINQAYVNLMPAMGHVLTATEATKQLLASGAAATILIGDDDHCRQMRTQLRAAGVHVVNASTSAASAPMIADVSIDDFAGGVLAAQHLQTQGYSRLIFLRPFTCTWLESRLAGAQSACAPGEPTLFPEMTTMDGNIDGTSQAMAGLAVAHTLLQAGLEPNTGVIAPNDAVAAAFIRVASEAGLSAGRDYGIVGFDDRERDIGLTSLRPPLDQIGAEAAAMVLRILQGETHQMRISLPYLLIPRTSTRPQSM